jgi:hypothetical protein
MFDVITELMYTESMHELREKMGTGIRVCLDSDQTTKLLSPTPYEPPEMLRYESKRLPMSCTNATFRPRG